MPQIQQSGTPVNLTSSGAVSKSGGTLVGFYVNSTSSGTIVLSLGGTSGGTAISGTITPSIGFHCFPAYCPTGAYATIGGTLDVTFFFAAG